VVSRASWKIMLATMIDSVLISKADAHMYVVLIEVEKHVPNGELVGTTECLMLYLRCCTDRGHYN
jgi:hypothetical protein